MKLDVQFPCNRSTVMNGNFVNLTLTKCNGTTSPPVHISLHYPGSHISLSLFIYTYTFLIDRSHIKISVFNCTCSSYSQNWWRRWIVTKYPFGTPFALGFQTPTFKSWSFSLCMSDLSAPRTSFLIDCLPMKHYDCEIQTCLNHMEEFMLP